jgi:hypothetical protein
MLNTLKIPSYNELVGLSDAELIKCVGFALSQLNNAQQQGESTTNKARMYRVYENELAKRNYRHRV